jgi:hypothetical protein
MVLALLLAHLVGDYILQWDGLSRWKSEKVGGVLVHGFIVISVTLLFTLPLDPSWWPWAVFVGVSHTLIDGIELPFRRHLAARGPGKSALALFLVDQALHLAIIVFALMGSGYLSAPVLADGLVRASNDHRMLTFVVAYAFLTMPAWIIIKFLVHGLLNGSAPDFTLKPESKYLGMFERGIIATMILLGQFLLIPLATLPRLIYDWPRSTGSETAGIYSTRRQGILYLAEVVTSIALAVGIGWVLRLLL